MAVNNSNTVLAFLPSAQLSRWGWLMRMRLNWKKSQNTLDTSNIVYRNKTRSTGSVGKGLGSQLCHDWNCILWNRRGCYSKVWGSFITDHHLGPSSRLLRHAGWGVSIITQILHGHPFTRPPSRSRVHVWLFLEHEPSAEGVCMCLWKVSLFSFPVQLERTWASNDDQAGFVTQCHGLKLLPNMYAVFKSRLIYSARICYWTQHNIIILTLWPWGGETYS